MSPKHYLIQSIMNPPSLLAINSPYSIDFNNNIHESFQMLNNEINELKTKSNKYTSINNENNDSKEKILFHKDKKNFPPPIHLDGKSGKESSFNNTIYFNENKFIDPLTHTKISDTYGDLKGSVYFAQNSIIPAVNRIEGDIQPTLVSERKTLVMFKPQQLISSKENIYVKIIDNNGIEIHTQKLSPPSELPKPSYLSIYKTNLKPKHFKTPTTFDMEINNVKQLNKMLENPSYFNQTISKSDKIKISFGHIEFTKNIKPIHLNSNKKYQGKNIVFRNNSNSNITFKYSNKDYTLKKNSTIQFICDKNGKWLTKSDTKQLKELSIARKIPSTFDYKLNQNNKIENYDSEIDSLLEINSSIKIDISKNSKKNIFKLKNNIKYSSKIINFTSESIDNKTIEFNNKNVSLKNGDCLYFICNKKGIWKKLSINSDVSKISLGRNFEYDEVISEIETLEKMNKNTQFMESFLLDNKREIRIDINDNNWVDSIKLPSGNRYCYITFNTTSSKNTKIFINDTYVELQKGKPLNFDFVTATQKWRNNPLIVLPEKMNNLEYMENTWSASIPKEYIKPNIKLEFIHKNKSGSLSNVTVGAPTKLTLHLLDIGIFTEPRDKYDFRDTPELNRQYYQNIPTSTLLINRYESTRVDQFVFGDGMILKNMIPEDGDWHERSSTKITRWLYSEGIHMATSGINSSPDDGPTFVPTPQIVVYSAVGKYHNGRVIHGGTGSLTGGIASVEDSIGNEFSHELGHNFDLADYYGGSSELGVHRAPHEGNSTWGWDADNNMFIVNFDRSGRAANDAMNGGSPKDHKDNAYTLYTPNTLAAIQKRLEKLYSFNANSTTGYQKWNVNTQKMEDTYLRLPNFLQFNVPVQNGEDISQYNLCKMLEKYNALKIGLGNGYHSPNIYLPTASSINAGNIIIIESFAEWSSTIHLNTSTEEIQKNETLTYISDGKSWIKSPFNELHKKPIKQDVPVITVLGYYDPEGQILVTDPEKQKSNHIQDVLYGSSGMIYEDNKGLAPCSSYLEFDLEDGTTRQYKLHGTNFKPLHMNRFHVNIERNLKPIKVKIFIKGELKESRDIEIRELKLPTTINGLTV